MNNSNSIVRNLLSITTGQILNLILSFLSITLAARMLGVNDFGNFGYLLAVVSLISKIMDLGFTPIVFRELSINKNNFGLLNNALTIRLIAFGIVISGFNAFLFVTNADTTQIMLANIILLNTVFSAKFVCVRELLDVPFKVNLKMHYPMIVTNIDNILLLIGVLLLPVFNNSIVFFISIYTISNIPGFILVLYILKKQFGYTFKPVVLINKWLIVQSLPIFGAIILDTAYTQMDVVILKWSSGLYHAGLYSGALRLVMPLLLFPTAIIYTIFPVLSKNQSVKGNDEFYIKLIIKVISIFAVLIFFGFLFKEEVLIVMVYGIKFKEAALPTSLLLFAQIFLFYNFFLINVLIAYKKQSANFKYSLLILSLHLLISFFIAPHYNSMGVAISKIFSGFIGSIFVTYTILSFNKNIKLFDNRIFYFAGIIGILFFLFSYFSIYIYIFLSAIFSVIIILITKLFTSDEIYYMFGLLNKPELAEKIVNNKILKYFI